MTTLSTSGRSPLVSRSLAVARMHFADPMTLFVMTWGVLAAIFTINLIVWQFVPQQGRNSGGAVSVYCFLVAVAVLAVARALPFALGMGSSRRAFLLGTLLTGLVLSICHALLLYVLQLLEKASGGWWSRGTFFHFEWFERSSQASVLLFMITSLTAAFVLGTLLSACWQRWNRLFMVVAGPLFVLVMGGLAVLVTAEHWWGHVGSWFATQTPLSAAGWCALAAVLLAAAVQPVLRRVRG